ncbi:histidinol-phosphate transaminase [Texcoconibacillus texcoconensis]|uniref:Histidinol-phosphate aminotransferase n=1 Tax=Texcoconibacillus texcoconensis TaxID=1095777 RepID=A0A840QNF7_9BACI|nr:histidinol-phosphate aminotransferase [Texcoconibacillus texcoconensis]
METKKALEGLSPYQPGKPIEEVKREFGLSSVIKLASNENPFGSSPQVKRAIEETISDLAKYPDGSAQAVKKDVAHFLGVDPSQLLFGNGSDEVLLILCRTFLKPGDNIVTATPTFPQYRHNAVIEGAEVREVPLQDGVHDLSAMLEKIDENTKIVFVCNPNNPTGTYVNEESFLNFLAQVPKDTIVVSDEAYYEYVTADDFPNTIPLIDQYPNLFITRTFSKAYGLASLRIGYGIGQATLVQKMDPAREPFNTSTIAQRAAQAALKDQSFIDACREKNQRGIQQYMDYCVERGLQYFPSETNFIIFDVGAPADDVFQHLLSKGYIVRSGQALGYPTMIRVTVGTEEENQGLLDELDAYHLQKRSS